MGVRILHLQSQEPLDRVASKVFSALDIPDYEERESDNYPGGTYYRGTIGDIEIKVAGETDDGWEDYQYWVVLTMDERDQADLDDACDALITRLLQHGFAVAREVGHTATSIERETYCFDALGNLTKNREQHQLPA